jgi:hypothetical protein
MESILYVQRRGVGLYMDGDELRAYPASRLDPNLRSFIRDHRDEIVTALNGEPDLDVTVGNILALSPEEIEQYQQELEASPDDRPYIDHDREALKRSQDILQRRMMGAA